MKHLSNFGFQKGIRQFGSVKNPSVFTAYEDNSELVRLLKIVYKEDENGIIQSDLAYLFSKDADPNVIKFIKDILQQDCSSLRQPSIPDGMSDDDVERYSPRLGELSDDYYVRLRGLIKEESEKLQKQKK